MDGPNAALSLCHCAAVRGYLVDVRHVLRVRWEWLQGYLQEGFGSATGWMNPVWMRGMARGVSSVSQGPAESDVRVNYNYKQLVSSFC
jgi:hypothetical protein